LLYFPAVRVGASAWVAINAESSALTQTFSTELPAGSYCDVITGVPSGDACTGAVVAVDGPARRR